MRARRKCQVARPTTGCWTKKATCIEEKKRVRRPAVRYSQKSKQKKNKYIHTQTHKSESESELRQRAVRYSQKKKQNKQEYLCLSMYVCMHSSPPKLQGVRVISARAHARMCAGTISLISLLCRLVCRCTPWNKHTHTHTHTQATLNTHTNTRQEMIETQQFHSSTTFQFSVTRNTHSLKRWKPGENVRWQDRQLVEGQMKPPVSRRHNE